MSLLTHQNILPFLLVLFFCPTLVVARPSSLFNASDGSSKMKLLGVAEAVGDKITLTPVTTSPTTTAGGVFFGDPIDLQDQVSGVPLPFSTSFTLWITNSNNGLTGGGVAFVMSQSAGQIGDAGGNLGVPIGAMAFEFDTKKDVNLADINNNHVGINLGSMISSKAVDLGLFDIDLRSGRKMNAWIDHSGVTQQLAVYVSYEGVKPKQPVLCEDDVSLIHYLGSRMHVGFTASTQGSTDSHVVGGWCVNSNRVYPDSGQVHPPETTSSTPIPKQVEWDWGSPLGVMVIFLFGVTFTGALGGIAYCIRCRDAKFGNRSCNDSFKIFCCPGRR